MDNYNITVNNSTFKDQASIVRNENYNRRDNLETLEELENIQNKLMDTADKLEKLQEALQKQDTGKISRLIRDLSNGTAASILANIASTGLKRLLNINI